MGNVGAVGHAEQMQRKALRGGRVARGTGVVGQATAAHRGRCALRRVGESFRIEIRSSVIRRKGRRGRRPLRWLRVGTFQRSREVQFITPVTLYAARPV